MFENLKQQYRTRELVKTAKTDLVKCLTTVKFITAYNQVVKLQKLVYVSRDILFNQG